MSNRKIVVTRCSPRTCPYCVPDRWGRKCNWCQYLENVEGAVSPPLSIKLKTFPVVCPLQEDKCDE